MPYSQDSELTNDIISEKELIELTDDEKLGTVNATRVAQARKKIDELIDGHLRAGGYTLPLASTPPMLNTISLDGTVYFIWERKKKHNMPEGMKKKYDAIMQLLSRIQKRQILIGADDPAETSGPGGYTTNKTADDRMFPKETLDKY